jgi:hypothetical protein
MMIDWGQKKSYAIGQISPNQWRWGAEVSNAITSLASGAVNPYRLGVPVDG